jgi:hypothetical protein
MSKRAKPNDSPILFIGILLLLIALLLAMQAKQRIERFHHYHLTLAENTVDMVAGEIVKTLDEKRRLLHLFTQFEAEALAQLAQTPDSSSLASAMEQRIYDYFPDALAFAIASPAGDLLVNSGGDLIDQHCRHDIFDFAAGLDPLPQIHANPWSYHYDIMVHINEPADYVLFVSFDTSGLTAQLRNSHRPSHQLLLLNVTSESDRAQ